MQYKICWNYFLLYSTKFWSNMRNFRCRHWFTWILCRWSQRSWNSCWVVSWRAWSFWVSQLGIPKEIFILFNIKCCRINFNICYLRKTKFFTFGLQTKSIKIKTPWRQLRTLKKLKKTELWKIHEMRSMIHVTPVITKRRR